MRRLSAMLLTTVLVATQSLTAMPDSFAQQTARDFTAVAKKATPAVVSIKVQSDASSRSNFQSDDLQDFFNNDFFRQFFLPRGQSVPQQQPVYGQASGFIVTPDGYILTNNHVVQNATEIQVTLNDRREFKGKIIGRDPNTDIAVIKIDATDLPYLELSNSDTLEVGQWAIAIGNPFGLQASLTVGVVGATGRNNLDIVNNEDFIQTDASLNRGNSGGPLLNIDGQVIGMNTAIVTNAGMGFAIPSNMLGRVMEQLIQSGSVTRGFIGVTMQNVDQELARAFDLKQAGGALITEVAKGSPADNAGLKQGDIILTFNKMPVTSITTLRNAVSLTKPGTKLNFTVLQNGKVADISITTGTYPEGKQQVAQLKSGNQLGFEVQDLTPESTRNLGLINEAGVLISKVDPNSPAALAGLKKGALILSVNQKQITSVEQFNAAISETPANKPVLLLVKQGEAIRFLSLKVD